MSTNGFDDTVRAGPVAGLGFLHYSLDWLAWGVDLGYEVFNRKASNGTTFLPSSGAAAATKASAASVLALAKVNLRSEAVWTPYFLGGVGINRFLAESSAGTSKRKPASTGASLAGAAGLETFVVRNGSLGFETRYQLYRLARRSFAADSAEALSFSLVVNYWF